MQVKMTGNVSEYKFEEKILDKLEEIVNSTEQRLIAENEGLQIEEVVFTEVTFDLAFKVKGQDDPQVLTVEHHEGLPEKFTWLVDLEASEESSNEEQSLFDSWTAAKARGEEMEFAEITSDFSEEHLTIIDSEEYSDMGKIVFAIEGSSDRLVQIYQNDKLVQEYVLTEKAEETKEETV